MYDLVNIYTFLKLIYLKYKYKLKYYKKFKDKKITF